LLDLAPRFLLKNFKPEHKKNAAIIFTTICIYVVVLLYNLFPPHNGYLFTLFTLIGRIRNILHHSLRCPLCGGTRSFLAMSVGNFSQALHFSLFGSSLFIYTLISLPFRVAYVYGWKNTSLSWLEQSDKWWENHFITIVLVCYTLQILLDKLNWFVWSA